MLIIFWGREKAERLRQLFWDADITQSPKNGISMNHHLHFLFDHARFALKPLQETHDGIVVQWHWLKRSVLKPMVLIQPEIDPRLQAGITDQSWGNGIAHRKSGVQIRTGQIFLIRANNPEDKVSRDLLQLHWDLLRVAAISGAADVTDDYYDYEDPRDSHYDAEVAAKQQAILKEHELSIAVRQAKEKHEDHGVGQSKDKQVATRGDLGRERKDGDDEPKDSKGGDAT